MSDLDQHRERFQQWKAGDWRVGLAAAQGYIDALEARVKRLEAAHEPMAAAVVAAYEFIRRECAEANPETGEIVEAGALPTWRLVCEGYAYAVTADKEADDE